MWSYWLFLAFPSFFALKWPVRKWGSAQILILALIYAIFIGLRFQVGGDWWVYLENLENLSGLNFQDAVFNPIGDPGYNFLSWLSNILGTGIYGVNFVCALIFSLGLLRFCNSQPRPWLALAVSNPYLVIVVAMGYTRQAVAIGLVMLAFLCLEEKRILRFFVYLFIATLFHKTAVIVVASAIPFVNASKKFSVVLIRLSLLIIVGFGLAYSFLAPRLDFFLYGYEQQAMQSQGAGIRVAMIIVPALLIILFHQRFRLNNEQKFLWLGLSWLSIACLAALMLLKSSTIVDRLALYCIPLQMFVGSRFAGIGLIKASPVSVSIVVLVIAAFVQFVWLNYALTASAWLPYDNLLFRL